MSSFGDISEEKLNLARARAKIEFTISVIVILGFLLGAAVWIFLSPIATLPVAVLGATASAVLFGARRAVNRRIAECS